VSKTCWQLYLGTSVATGYCYVYVGAICAASLLAFVTTATLPVLEGSILCLEVFFSTASAAVLTSLCISSNFADATAFLFWASRRAIFAERSLCSLVILTLPDEAHGTAWTGFSIDTCARELCTILLGLGFTNDGEAVSGKDVGSESFSFAAIAFFFSL